MKSDVVFYETHELPTISKQRAFTSRRRLLGLALIEVPEGYINNDSEDSVRIIINTPILRSQAQRGVGKVMKNVPERNNMKHKRIKDSLIVTDWKETSSKSPPELERLTVSEKKLQRNAKAVGLKVERKLPSAIKFFDLSKSFKTSQTKLLHNRNLKIMAEKKDRTRKAVKLLITIAKRRRDVLRGINWKPQTEKLNNTVAQKEVRLDKKVGQSERAVNNRNAGLIEGELKTIPSHKKEVKKKIRRHTVAETQGISNFIGALEQLALAPINPSV